MYSESFMRDFFGMRPKSKPAVAYQVVTSWGGAAELNAKVEARLREGWELLGGVTSAWDAKPGYSPGGAQQLFLAQSMVRR